MLSASSRQSQSNHNLLTRLLEGSGIRREEVYLSNLVRFRPPHNRPPTSAEIAAFSPYVDEELSILQPVLILPDWLSQPSPGHVSVGVGVSHPPTQRAADNRWGRNRTIFMVAVDSNEHSARAQRLS